jgi:uncharacterized membrane protein YgcG
MICPACGAPLQETDSVCGACGFTLTAADQLFGIPPQLERPVHDLTESALTKSQARRLASLARRLERRFSQLQPAIVFAPSCEPAPLAAYAFWLFNRGSLFSPSESGGENFGALLVIDCDRSEAAAVIGFGLEPLFPQEALTSCVEAARTQLQQRDRLAAATSFFQHLEQQLLALHPQMDQAFGLARREDWFTRLQDLHDRSTTIDF